MRMPDKKIEVIKQCEIRNTRMMVNKEEEILQTFIAFNFQKM